MEQEKFVGLVERLIKEIIRMIKNMEKENIVLLMEIFIKEILRIIKDMEKENFVLLMEIFTMANGKTLNLMGKVK